MLVMPMLVLVVGDAGGGDVDADGWAGWDGCDGCDVMFFLQTSDKAGSPKSSHKKQKLQPASQQAGHRMRMRARHAARSGDDGLHSFAGNAADVDVEVDDGQLRGHRG